MADDDYPMITLGTKIVAVWGNYSDNDEADAGSYAVPTDPIKSLKPPSTYVRNGGKVQIPPTIGTTNATLGAAGATSGSLYYGVNLAVVIDKEARNVTKASAMDYVKGYAIGLNMTTMKIHCNCKAADLPEATCYDTFTPISELIPKTEIDHPDNLELWWKLDDNEEQSGLTEGMIKKIPYLIESMSSIMTLYEGDVILTGHPKKAGTVNAGQTIYAGIKAGKKGMKLREKPVNFEVVAK